MFKSAIAKHLNDMCRHLLAELCRDECATAWRIQTDEYVADRDVYVGIGMGQSGTQEVNEGAYVQQEKSVTRLPGRGQVALS